MDIGIIGAGVSGLSIGKLLYKNHKVEVLEKSREHGGIAKTLDVNGIAYHRTGGHCFNSKHPDVLNFVFNNILPKHKWHEIQRKAVIKFKDKEISYPIEYSVKDIHRFDPKMAIDITKDFLGSNDDGKYDNLEIWFRKKFGDRLAEEYFIPYNTKIWNKHPKEMSPAWVEGKLPIPDKFSFFKGLITNEKDKMPHSSFYYPNTNNQNTFIDSLAKDLIINYNFKVESIEKVNNKWIINGEKEYDILISTMPLDILPNLIKNTPKNILDSTSKLKYNKVTTMLWETIGTDNTWTYLPEINNIFHRYIHIGNFFSPKQNYSITEAVGLRTREEMIENGKKDPFLLNPVDYHVSDHAYVVFDENYNYATNHIKNYLDKLGIYTLGRFGEWQYYNMDVCIKSSLDMQKVILQS